MSAPKCPQCKRESCICELLHMTPPGKPKPNPAPSAEPEFIVIANTEYRLTDIRAVLSRAGLAIVPAADRSEVQLRDAVVLLERWGATSEYRDDNIQDDTDAFLSGKEWSGKVDRVECSCSAVYITYSCPDCGKSPAADVPSAEERKVLEACEEAKRRLLVMIESLEADEDGTTDNDLLLVDLDGIRNVLARRAAKEGKTDG